MSARRKRNPLKSKLLKHVRYLRSEKGHRIYGGTTTIKVIRRSWPELSRPSYYMVRKLLKELEAAGKVWYSTNGVVGYGPGARRRVATT